ncbi:hypothetical protein MSG28_013967 [Choristoneura fumiferana]|uniref:Uncharacterized protein n=1 Tax=Choristoneura fumiferana TaxID=7141 RepID=A0ACC0K9G6_CHOFU|nr:hypothetical protein MSG28_013967 [Choristoneura fumiferana]
MALNPRSGRLAYEIKLFQTRPPWGVVCNFEKDDQCDMFLVTMRGPKGTPYEDGSFKLTITIPEKYPFEPPLVKFVTPVYHPNIDKGGRICMDLLKMPPKGAWTPTITLDTLLITLQTLLANPNPDDPLMMDIAMEYKENIDTFMKNARAHTEKHAREV